MELTLRLGTGSTTSHIVSYRDLNLPAGAIVQLVLTPQTPDALRYDANNDGVFETTIVPTNDVSGGATQDREGPTISAATATLTTGQVQVTLTAQDASGVQVIAYSLDGTTFQRYTGPVVVIPTQTPIIYAFAEDQASNRSPLFSQKVVVPVTNAAVRPVLECVANNGNSNYTAYFGYKNDNTVAITIPIGGGNTFTPTPQGRGQSTTFQPGRQVKVFGVRFNGSNLVWSLKGPDGKNRTATASSTSKACTP
jgi:hypothetical protein